MHHKYSKRIAMGCLTGVLLAAPVVHAQEDYAARTESDLASEAQQQRDAAVAAIAADRHGTITDIVNRLGTSDTTGQFEANLALATAEQLYEISNAASFEEASNILLFGSAAGSDQLGVIEPEQLDLGQTNRDFVYTPVAPCRVVDTRLAGGIIIGGFSRAFNVYGNGATIGAQGGNLAGCSSPRGEPRAVHLNVTILPQAGNGFVKVYPANIPAPNASLVNYTAGVNIANAATVQTFFNLIQKEIRVLSSQNVHVVIDVLGFYHEVDKIVSELVQVKQGGYDIDQSSANGAVIDSTTETFVEPQNGNTTVTLSGGEDILVTVSMQVYKSSGANNHIEGEVKPAYRNTSTLAVTTGSLFESETDFCFSSTGENDQRSVQASHFFDNMPAGTFEFGFVANKGSSFGCWSDEVDFVVAAPKINVVKVNN